ncbi:MAG: DUF1015 domain-containing protein [Chlorobi bacterium]|nr:DUF1015 domain-containing protein [Chlorobiota bacterium]
MARIQPFQAVRPVRNKVCIVPAYSYERYNQHEINRLIKSNPYSFLNIIASNYIRRLPKDKKYKAIRKQYAKFKRKGIYMQDYLPFLYLLRITDVLGNRFTGFVGLAAIDDYADGKILKHENTIDSRVKLFSEYLETVRIQAEPVMLAYPPESALSRLIEKYQGQVLEYEFSTTDGTVYELWLISDFEDIKKIRELFEEIPKIYIADGHHRVESTYRMRENLKSRNPYHTGNEAYNYILSFFIPYDQLKIYPFHRSLQHLNGLSEEEFLRRLEEKFRVEKLDKYRDPDRHEMILYMDGRYYSVKIPSELTAGGRNDLDVLNREVFQNILGITDPRNSKIVKYHHGKFGVKCVLRRLKEKKAKAVFFMHPLTFTEIKAVADAGHTLPPKSTYIDPKLLTGLLIYEF